MSRFGAKVQTYLLLLNPGQMAAVDAFLDSQWHLPLLALPQALNLQFTRFWRDRPP